MKDRGALPPPGILSELKQKLAGCWCSQQTALASELLGATSPRRPPCLRGTERIFPQPRTPPQQNSRAMG